MTTIMRLGLTGTPGSGKTSVANLMSGMGVISVKELANRHGCLAEKDPYDASCEIDVTSLFLALDKLWSSGEDVEPSMGEDEVVVEGHLSHLLPVNCIVILRCNPETLKARLEGRGWSEEKIRENVEWELMGGPWIELAGHPNSELPIIEIDTTCSTSSEVRNIIEQWIDSGMGKTTIGEIDWMNILAD